MKRSVLFGGIAVAVVAAAGLGYELVLPRIAQATLERNVAQFRATLPPGSSLTYDHAAAHALQRSASFDNLRLTQPDGLTLTAAHLDVAPAGPHRLRHLHATGLDLHRVTADREASVRIAELDADDLRDDAIPQPPAAALAETSRETALLQHGTVGTLDATGLDTTITAAGLPGGKVHVTADALQLHDFGSGRSSDLSVRHLALPELTYSFDRRLPAAGLDTKVIRHAAITLGGMTMHHVRLADLATFIAAGRRDGSRALGQPSDVGLDQLDVAISGETGPEGEVRIAAIRDVEHAAAPQSRNDLTLDGIDLPAGRLKLLMPDALGDGRLHGSLVARGDGDNATGMFHLRVMQFGLDHVGTLRVTADGHVDPNRMIADPSAPSALAATTFETASVAIADGGLRTAMLKMSAAATGTTPEAFATLLAARAQANVSALGDAGAKLGPAIASFLEKGGALTVSAHPTQPIALNALNAGSQDALVGLLTKLNLDAQQSTGLPPLPG